MKKKFITYGSNTFVQSAKRIAEEAKTLGIFDEIQRYAYSDLPFALKSSPLFVDKSKGGYWIWKAYVIYDSLSRLDQNDILVYSDSGCELRNAHLWQNYFNLLNDSDAIFFQYRDDVNYGWKDFNKTLSDSPKLKHWIKKRTTEYFRPIFNNDDEWLEKTKLLAGFSIIKKTPETLQLVRDWLDVMLYHPELVIDPLLEERSSQRDEFATHRHDQSILSIIVRHYQRKIKLIIMDEMSEGDHPDQILKASRRVDRNDENKLKTVLKKIYYKVKK